MLAAPCADAGDPLPGAIADQRAQLVDPRGRERAPHLLFDGSRFHARSGRVWDLRVALVFIGLLAFVVSEPTKRECTRFISLIPFVMPKGSGQGEPLIGGTVRVRI
jgi:hypothetical protein